MSCVYKSIAGAAGDWFYVQTVNVKNNDPIVFRVAAWALTEDGRVVGLVATGGGSQVANVSPRLFSAASPGVEGDYFHRSQLPPNALAKIV